MRHVRARVYKPRGLSYFAFTPSGEMDVEVYFFCPSHGGRDRSRPCRP
jgi:hypothetical protein